jgi:hypothetical protein
MYIFLQIMSYKKRTRNSFLWPNSFTELRSFSIYTHKSHSIQTEHKFKIYQYTKIYQLFQLEKIYFYGESYNSTT